MREVLAVQLQPDSSQTLSRKRLAYCTTADAVLTAIALSSVIPTKRMEFSAPKTCTGKRLSISDDPDVLRQHSVV